MKLWSLLGALVLLAGCSGVKFATQPTDSGPAAQAVIPDGHTYTWSTGSFGSCSIPCGGGVQTRTVECKREDNVVVPDSNCAAAKPSPTQSCNTNACTTTYTWNPGSWSDCSLLCGGGTRTRSVLCQLSNGTTVADSSCSAATKPVTSQACNVDACAGPITYSWQTGAVGSCDCTTQTKSQAVTCKRNDGATAADHLCTDTKPATQIACTSTEIQSCVGSATYSWLAGSWSSCSASCGGGVQTRALSCQRSTDLAYVSSSYCTSAAPATQQSCNTQACAGTTRAVVNTTNITPANNSLDVVLVIDNSISMLADNLRLASRMTNFLSNLDNLGVDYQVCVTTTDDVSQRGAPIVWQGVGSYVINKNTPNKASAFTNTITAIGANGSGNEVGIRTFNRMVTTYRNSGCFRDQAALTVIGITDEDEASVGGNASLDQDSYQPLEAWDYPTSAPSVVANAFNTSNFTKKFIWNSIIVKPGDVACYNQQQAEDSLSVAFYGTFYSQLSALTGGYVGSICESDYTQNLNYIGSVVTNTISSLTLECSPVGAVTVTTANNFATTTTVQGNKIFFNPVLPQAAQWVRLSYNCPL